MHRRIGRYRRLSPAFGCRSCEGAVCNGLEPGAVTTRRSALTYGVEVLHRFDADRHPASSKVHRDGVDWCTGVFDTFVHANQVLLSGVAQSMHRPLWAFRTQEISDTGRHGASHPLFAFSSTFSFSNITTTVALCVIYGSADSTMTSPLLSDTAYLYVS